MKRFTICARLLGSDVFEMEVEARSHWQATLAFCRFLGLRPSALLFCWHAESRPDRDAIVRDIIPRMWRARRAARQYRNDALVVMIDQRLERLKASVAANG